jgi:hypothetical protein
MTTSGFHWEGFLRAIQPEITDFLVFLLVMLAFYLIARLIIHDLRSSPDTISPEILQRARKGSNWVTFGLISIAFVFLGIRVASYALSTRVPRADADRQSVYEQMDSHTRESE